MFRGFYTYSSWSSMPLSSRPDDELVLCPAADLSAGNPNSRSACSSSGVGVSNTNVSTIDPFDDPNETLEIYKIPSQLYYSRWNENTMQRIWHSTISYSC